MPYYKALNNSVHFLDAGIDPASVPRFPIGAIQITDAEALATVAANTPALAPPTPLEQIRALEQQHADAQAKLTRQSLLTIALDRACADPAAAGLSREQVHSVLMQANTGYTALYTLEQQVEALRVQL